MTAVQRGAVLVFFGQGKDRDAAYLDQWRTVPLTYRPGQPVSERFRRDHYEIPLLSQVDSAAFARAADHLLRYHFYPPAIMSHVSDFSLANRRMRPGDRLIQRIRAANPFGWTIVEGITMNEIWSVTDEARRAGFTYVTTEAHEEIGEWSAQIEWRADHSLLLTVSALSRTSDRIPRWMSPLTRRVQQGAHHAGIAHFRQIITSG